MFFDGNRVIKIISNVYFDSYETALDRIALHNFLSPKTPLAVLGFGLNYRNEYGIVVSQPFVKGRHLPEAEISRYLAGMEFKKQEDMVAMTEYTRGDYYIGDMHDENVILTPDGNIALIDTDSRLNVPELKCGGTYAVPEISFSRSAVSAIDSALREIVPVEVSRHEYEERFATKDNFLKEQLEQTGRYNGYLLMADKDDQTRPFVLQVDPSDSTRLLRTWCDSIAVMLDKEKNLTEKESRALSSGLAITRNQETYAFNPDRGRVTSCKRFTLKQKIDEKKEKKHGIHL